MGKISVIIICFNAEDSLEAAISSVSNQTYKNLEILVIDDGSADCSAELAEAFARRDERVRVIRCKENRGILAARKEGVRQATGDWIMHLDADDLFMPDACEKAMETIGQQKADFVQFGSIVAAADAVSEKEILRKKSQLNPPAMHLDLRESQDPCAILRACFKEQRFSYTQWNKIYAAGLLKKAYSFIEADHINMGEDMYALFVITSMAGKMAVIEEPLYVYHFGKGISCANKKAPMQAFQNSCLTMRAVSSVQKYIRLRHEEETLSPYIRRLRREMLDRTLTRFYPLIPGEYKLPAVKSLLRWWTAKELFAYMIDRRLKDRLSHITENQNCLFPALRRLLFQRLLHNSVLCPDNQNY